MWYNVYFIDAHLTELFYSSCMYFVKDSGQTDSIVFSIWLNVVVLGQW